MGNYYTSIAGSAQGAAMNELEPFQHPRFTRAYQRISAESERRGSAAHRDRMLAGLTGRVIEVGAGNGLNFPHYPPGVTEVLAVEPENQLRALAEQAAATALVPVRVVAGHANRLPAEDGSFDAAIASLVLCSVPDLKGALTEIHRVLEPGGELRFYEHVRSSRPLRGALDDLVAPLWKLCGGGCHPNRRTAEAITAAGFRVEYVDRFPFRPTRYIPATDHIIGTARKPA
jgi:ubiquinone/menaquinone biosynthesis C-methylase UbiE